MYILYCGERAAFFTGSLDILYFVVKATTVYNDGFPMDEAFIICLINLILSAQSVFKKYL